MEKMTQNANNQSANNAQSECTCSQVASLQSDRCDRAIDKNPDDQGAPEMPGEIMNPKELKNHNGLSPSPNGEFKAIRNDLRVDANENKENCVYTISNGVGGNATTQNSVKAKKLPNTIGHVEEPDREGCFKRIFYSEAGPNNIKLLVAEFIGTGLLLFLGCMGCLGDHIGVPGYMASFSFGLTVMVIIQMFGHISGAHLNPAVTMVTVLSGIVELKSAPFYLLGQFAGAICGLGGLKLLLPPHFIAQDFIDDTTNATIHKQGLCTTNLNPNLTAAQGFGIEVVITFILIFICYAIWDKRNTTKQDSVPIRFGFLIAAIGIAAGPLSGGSMNTARSFAPALLNNDWENQWVYWLGPTLGGLIAHYLYKFIFAVPDDEPTEDDYEEVALKNMNKNDAKV